MKTRGKQACAKAKAEAVVAVLKEAYPDAACALVYEGEPWRLLVMGRLSAQCTDARVNIVCKDLFAKYNMEICAISVHGNGERILLVARYDNLGKGASGAAVECMNLAFGDAPEKGLVL